MPYIIKHKDCHLKIRDAVNVWVDSLYDATVFEDKEYAQEWADDYIYEGRNVNVQEIRMEEI